MSLGKVSLILGALIAMATAVAHLSCIVLGPTCFEAQMAPPELVASAAAGTWLAPVATVCISMLFILCGVFALSAAGIIRELPLTNIALLFIAGLCALRGIATVPLSFLYPDMVSTFSIVAGCIWFLSGVLFFVGFVCARGEGR